MSVAIICRNTQGCSTVLVRNALTFYQIFPKNLYLIRIAPPAFVPHCRIRSGQAPSPQVVYGGLSHFTGPHRILLTPPDPEPTSLLCTPTG